MAKCTELLMNLVDAHRSAALVCMASTDTEFNEEMTKNYMHKSGDNNKIMPGGITSINEPPLHMFFLVLKEESEKEAKYQDVHSCLELLREQMLKNNTFDVFFHRENCNDHGLKWKRAKHYLKKCFKDDNININLIEM